MEITRAEMEDAEALLALQKLAYQSEAALYNDDSIAPLHQTLDDLRGELKSQIFLKALEDEGIVGSLRASMKDETCHIGRLMVHPDFQGRGSHAHH